MNIIDLIKEQNYIIKQFEDTVKREKSKLAELEDLKLNIILYKKANPSDSFYVWCAKKNFNLTHFQIAQMNKIQI